MRVVGGASGYLRVAVFGSLVRLAAICSSLVKLAGMFGSLVRLAAICVGYLWVIGEASGYLCVVDKARGNLCGAAVLRATTAKYFLDRNGGLSACMRVHMYIHTYYTILHMG